MIYIHNGNVITPFKTINNGVVVVEGSKIIAVGKKEEISFDQYSEMINANGLFIIPGFIDLHVHGGGGQDVQGKSKESILAVGRYHLQHGTTSFLPTIMTQPWEEMKKDVMVMRDCMDTEYDGAEILGIYLEGPYVSPKYCSSHEVKYTRKPSISELMEIVNISRSSIKILTIAPELNGALEMTQEACQRGIVVAIGHSDSSYEETMAGIHSGMTHATHAFNAMRGFHHRELGAVGAILLSEEVTAEIVPDGVHVHPETVKLLIKIKGIEQVVAVTDASSFTGMPQGTYLLGKQKLIVKDGRAVLEDRTLAGSLITMNTAFRNIIRWGKITLPQAVKMTSFNPAKVIGFSYRKGSIEPGKDADIILIDDWFNVKVVMVGGKIKFEAPNWGGF